MFKITEAKSDLLNQVCFGFMEEHFLIARDVVLVTINSRVGVLGNTYLQTYSNML